MLNKTLDEILDSKPTNKDMKAWDNYQKKIRKDNKEFEDRWGLGKCVSK